MAKLIVKSPYFKCGGQKVSGYMKYIATREHVQKLPDSRPPTQKQEQLISKLLKDFPDSKNLFEYQSYASEKTKSAASDFISAALSCNQSEAAVIDTYMNYIATRPRAERLGSHGLFGDEDVVDLNSAMAKLDTFTGNVWTHIISLKREDAARLGYDNAGAWRELMRTHRNEIASTMQIPPENFCWYAAFHDEGEHPHVHMMAWSKNPKEGYLTKDGISLIRSKLTNDIFSQELLCIYEQKSVSRDELVRQARCEMLSLVRKMKSSVCDAPQAEALMLELSQTLETVKGKKQYGYLPKPAKALVDEIVDELEQLPVVQKCFEKWRELQGQVQSYYTGEAPMPLKLSEQKEFRSIKNIIIREAERLRLGELTFEDESMAMEDVPLDDSAAGSIYQYQKKIIMDEEETLERRGKAAREMNELAESGNKYAQCFLGKLYLSGDGTVVIPDVQRARDYFEAAAAHGHAPSQYALGKLYLSDDYSVRDPERGLEWLKAAANRGNPYAAYCLGKEYLKGEVVRKDIKLAKNYLTEAAEQGNSCAQYALGMQYLTGKHISRDTNEARHWLTLSEYSGNEYARVMLTRMDAGQPPLPVLALTAALCALSEAFQDNSLPKRSTVGMRIDRKRMREIIKRKQSLGQKVDAQEIQRQNELQFMGY